MKEEATKHTEYREKRLEESDKIFFENPIFTARAKGVGKLSRDEAVKPGAGGPAQRGSGVDYDVRKDEPYAAYPELDFNVCTRQEGDSYARTMARIDEKRESCTLIRQIVQKIPSGTFRREAPMVAPSTAR